MRAFDCTCQLLVFIELRLKKRRISPTSYVYIKQHRLLARNNQPIVTQGEKYRAVLYISQMNLKKILFVTKIQPINEAKFYWLFLSPNRMSHSHGNICRVIKKSYWSICFTNDLTKYEKDGMPC